MSFVELAKQFYEMGCTDETLCAIASRVYIDLQNVVKAQDLEKNFDPQLNFIYLFGKINSENNLYLPVSSTADIDFSKIETIQNKLDTGEKKRIILSICDPNSTILYYEINRNWVEN